MLSRIQIQNLGPFESFDSGKLPAVALISGDNGIGKTGLLECIKWVGASGHDPDMIHGGAEAGEVIVTTDTGAQLRARITRKETTRGWKPKPAPAPPAALNPASQRVLSSLEDKTEWPDPEDPVNEPWIKYHGKLYHNASGQIGGYREWVAPEKPKAQSNQQRGF